MNNNKPPSEATSSEEKMTYAIYDLKTAMEFIAVQAQRAAQRDAEIIALRKENEELKAVSGDTSVDRSDAIDELEDANLKIAAYHQILVMLKREMDTHTHEKGFLQMPESAWSEAVKRVEELKADHIEDSRNMVNEILALRSQLAKAEKVNEDSPHPQTPLQ